VVEWSTAVARLLLFGLGTGAFAATAEAEPLGPRVPVKGWTILSNSEPDAMAVIAAAGAYDINHLELSHDIVHDLREIRDPKRQGLVNRLVDTAHTAGIRQVLLWDHALYDLNYYPAEFRTGPGGTIDLDNPKFWEWFKADYRAMLDLAPAADGIVLTFIETGARAERQHSRTLPTPQDKLAAVVNAVADVVIGERKLTLYARTFSYTHEEYRNIAAAIAKFNRPEVRLAMKEVPHDFFLTHPNDFFAGTIARPTLIEFDTGAEYNGQGLIANTWPEYILQRAKDLLRRRHVTGYVARTDRYGLTRIIGRPSEINLLALKRVSENPRIDADAVYDEFITARYGRAALPHVKAAFKNAFAIITSTLYTLGTNTANHSKLDYDPYASSYSRSVSGKWIDPPEVFVRHDVNKKFHYWKDVVDHLAPAWGKVAKGTPLTETPEVLERGWLRPGDLIDETYFNYVRTEKAYGVRLAVQSVQSIERARPHLTDAQYQDLHHYFARTLLTAKLHQAVATAYFGFRLYARGEKFRTGAVMDSIPKALSDIFDLARDIREYPVKPATGGQWNWVEDADEATRYVNWITTGWPKETRGFPNPYGGLRYEEPLRVVPSK
jgi:hypothetical protein